MTTAGATVQTVKIDAGEKISARDKLLAAAAALMTERDTVDVTINEVAGRAGVNSALISYYFGGKEGLLTALAMGAARVAVADLDSLMAMRTTAAIKLKHHIAGIINTFYAYPYLNRLLWALMRDTDSASARQLSNEFMLPVMRVQKALLEEGAATGEIRPTDPMLFFFQSMGACEYLFSGAFALKLVYGVDRIDDDLRRRYVAETTALFMNGYLTKPPA